MASESERRAKLLSLKNSVRAFFEMTTVAPRQKGHPWGAAFRAVRSNDYMAESFIEELQALLDYIEAAFATAPPREAPPELEEDPEFDEQTRVAGPRGMAKFTPTRGRESQPVGEARPSRPASSAPPAPPPRPIAREAAPPAGKATPARPAAPPARPTVAPPARSLASPPVHPVVAPPRPSVAGARSSAPIAARSAPPAAVRPSAVRPTESPPPPARPNPGATRKNQFVDLETTVSAPPTFGLDDRTGPATLPPDSPRRRR